MLSALVCVSPVHSAQAVDDDASVHHHEHKPEVSSGSGPVLTERLGEFLPMNLTFIDEDGNLKKLGELIRRPTIITPVYYRCPNVCGLLLSGLARALPGVKLTPGEDFKILSVSFDETETPEIAARSKRNNLAMMPATFPVGAWRFLTGDKESIDRLMKEIGYGFEKRGEDFIHPVAVVVVDGKGRITRYLSGTYFLPMDITLALTEAGEGRVGRMIRSAAAFCFTYDPGKRTYVFNLLKVSATVILLTAGSFLTWLIFAGRRRQEKS